MWRPEKIYKAEPPMYIAFGFTASHLLPTSSLSLIGGSLFVVIGLIIYDMRTKK